MRTSITRSFEVFFGAIPISILFEFRIIGLSQTDDRVILEWTAQQNRVMLTHDVQTMTQYAYDRVQAGLAMPGVFEISRSVPIGLAIEEILLIAEASLDGEWEGQVALSTSALRSRFFKLNLAKRVKLSIRLGDRLHFILWL